jgi:glycosidase
VPFLPDLNQNNAFVANYLIQHALWTVEYFGIDGWRVDTYQYNDLPFMNRCNAALLRSIQICLSQVKMLYKTSTVRRIM